MRIHILRCVHGGERTALHVVVQNVFVTIAKDAKFHVLQKQTHVLLPLAMKVSHHRIDIMLSIDDVNMLVDVIITTPLELI